MLEGKRVVVTGGTGSLGQVIVRRLLEGELGEVESVLVFSRDEAKQNAMRLAYDERTVATDEVMYRDYRRTLRFAIGDVADEKSLRRALQGAHVVFHAAALKQVPSCEYFPTEAVRTNVRGAENVVRVVSALEPAVEAVIGISTDKACKPVNVMGMTKALQERIFLQANLDQPATRFVSARYGNVLASRGSVIPLFLDQVRRGGPVTLTQAHMTRFLMTQGQAIDTIFEALRQGQPGEIYVPLVASARMGDVAAAVIGDRAVSVVETGLRPGEKIHEILISEEEAPRTVRRGDYLVIRPMLPELQRSDGPSEPAYGGREYSSADQPLSAEAAAQMLRRDGLLADT
jgi:FlaA1/EpsC-like NDP-sugar epimerase